MHAHYPYMLHMAIHYYMYTMSSAHAESWPLSRTCRLARSYLGLVDVHTTPHAMPLT